MRDNSMIQSHHSFHRNQRKNSMMHSSSKRRMMIIRSSCFMFSLFNLMFVLASPATRLCRPDQRDALWEFKSEFSIQEFRPYTTTQMWRNNTDCCSWDGVSCDPKTGEVVELYLGGSYLNGYLRSNSSLFKLQHLQSLDLGSNDLLSGVLPDSIGNLKHLRVLRLTGSNFYGKIPSSLGNLSYLTHLWINQNQFTGDLPDSMANLNQLRELQLGDNKFSGNFPHMLLNLSALTQIKLAYNQFKGMLPSNMSSLSKLEDLDSSENSFSGFVPPSLIMIPSLVNLDLSGNDFSGSFEIVNISSPSKLRTLYLGKNNFSGPIPGFISKLVGLAELDLSFWNTGRGMVDLSLFSNLTSLSDLDLSGNKLKLSSTLHLPSSISLLSLSSCNLLKFPEFLEPQTRLDDLDISANQIEGQVPEWLWRLPLLEYVNISHNSFSSFEGSADVIQRSGKLDVLDISSNKFEGPFPWLPNSTYIILGSNNRFSGEIPRTICELVSFGILDLSNNNFSGSIPQCFNTSSLAVLNFRNNSLSGVLPEESIGAHLISLDVGHNQLSGELPKSLINCTGLTSLNMEENRFNDMFPISLRLLPNLLLLVLRSNELHGPIYSYGDSLGFPNLRIFDISKNSFSGVLPSDYFASWNTMSSVSGVDIKYGWPYGSIDSVAVANKGLNMELVGRIFDMYKTIDVSGNKFEGDIPESIGLLKGLIVLNMSNNAFTGPIPLSIVNLTNLESLDLSQNKLSGEIPPELAKLMFLAWMNFSNNKLEGPIPQGTQIQTQNSSSFAENPRLCGAPLQETCGGGGGEQEEEETTKQEEDEEKDQVLSWIAAAIGYVPGVFCGLTIGHILTSYKHDWFMRIFHSST